MKHSYPQVNCRLNTYFTFLVLHYLSCYIWPEMISYKCLFIAPLQSQRLECTCCHENRLSRSDINNTQFERFWYCVTHFKTSWELNRNTHVYTIFVFNCCCFVFQVIRIGNASIRTPNLPAINGYIHIIDHVRVWRASKQSCAKYQNTSIRRNVQQFRKDANKETINETLQIHNSARSLKHNQNGGTSYHCVVHTDCTM